jgi:hypothetical protein
MARRNVAAISKLFRAVWRKFRGNLPSWMVARVEAKALAKRDHLDRTRARNREIKAKGRDRQRADSIRD